MPGGRPVISKFTDDSPFTGEGKANLLMVLPRVVPSEPITVPGIPEASIRRFPFAGLGKIFS